MPRAPTLLAVRQIGPTQFEMRATDFYPERELEILIATPHPME